MAKTILITGSTDGIGQLAAKKLHALGHKIILHGRNKTKLEKISTQWEQGGSGGPFGMYVADFSSLESVTSMAQSVLNAHPQIDVLINNAGILKTTPTTTASGHDVRFMVNTIAPYALTRHLLPIIPDTGRVINLSSAAQRPVNLEALTGGDDMDDMDAYAQSKLAITMWTRAMALASPSGPLFIALNPGSLLATNMVKDGFGIPGNDINIGADIIVDAATSARFEGRSGAYFDNDAKDFATPHPDVFDDDKISDVMGLLADIT